jgi:hypothetical protein
MQASWKNVNALKKCKCAGKMQAGSTNVKNAGCTKLWHGMQL